MHCKDSLQSQLLNILAWSQCGVLGIIRSAGMSPDSEAAILSNARLVLCRDWTTLADLTFKSKKPHFVFRPKNHAWEHMVRIMISWRLNAAMLWECGDESAMGRCSKQCLGAHGASAHYGMFTRWPLLYLSADASEFAEAIHYKFH